MGCCNNKHNVNKVKCPLCKIEGEAIHFLVVESVVKKELASIVIDEQYYTCRNSDCEVIFYNESYEKIFLIQDIDLSSDFKNVTKSSKSTCGSGCGKKCNH
ncbi:hypothetical protein [Alkaliphilus peptidifermentans]|uniref:CopZ zinc binding domain-containing protein n=1 Tax=Alkaliphilus peptidifermentans DSM 18978 TaxID=1120976 RepID=A0A1G5HQI3_9FIRM|nr:hypothetical protein [Alkaliphilus peptidifermentans]SCY66056.1 hypothetical protein SAMN03080606_02090 [Alkaliphilus peptidifermentans DSM 18978]